MLIADQDWTSALELRSQANEALVREDLRDAHLLLERAAEAATGDDDSRLLLAKLAFDRGQLVEAGLWAVEAIALRPHHPLAYKLLVAICAELGEGRLARTCAKRGADLAPGLTFPKALVSRPAAKQKQARPWKLIKPLKALLKRRPQPLAFAIAHTGDQADLRATLESLPPAASVCIATCVGGIPESAGSESIQVLPDTLREGDFAEAWRRAAACHTSLNIVYLTSGEIVEASLREQLSAPVNPLLLASLIPVQASGRLEARVIRNVPGLEFDGFREPNPRRTLYGIAVTWGLGLETPNASIGGSPAYGSDREVEAVWWGEWLQASPENGFAACYASLYSKSETPQERHELVRNEYQKLLQTPLPFSGYFLEPFEAVLADDARRAADAPTLVELAGHALSRNPDSWGGRLIEAEAALLSGELDRARELLVDAGWDELPHTQGVRTADELRAHEESVRLRLADALLRAQDLPHALLVLDDLCTRAPNSADAQIAALSLALAARQIEGVPHRLEQIALQFADDPDPWLRTAQVLSAFPELAELTSHWVEQALARFDDHSALHAEAADAKIAIGEAPCSESGWQNAGQAETVSRQLGLALLGLGAYPEVEADQVSVCLEALDRWIPCWSVIGLGDQVLEGLHNIEPHSSLTPIRERVELGLAAAGSIR